VANPLSYHLIGTPPTVCWLPGEFESLRATTPRHAALSWPASRVRLVFIRRAEAGRNRDEKTQSVNGKMYNSKTAQCAQSAGRQGIGEFDRTTSGRR